MAVGYMKKRLVNHTLKMNSEEFTKLREMKESQRYMKLGVIQKWEPGKRTQLERDLLSRSMSLRAMAAHYGVSVPTIQKYKDHHFAPALKAAAQNEEAELRDTARSRLGWLYDELKDSITKVKDVTGPKERVAVHGNVATLLGLGIRLVETHGKMTGELADNVNAGASSERQVINVISLPKIEGTPEKGGQSSVDYSRMKLLDVQAQSE